jgi:hypothetical protein
MVSKTGSFRRSLNFRVRNSKTASNSAQTAQIFVVLSLLDVFDIPVYSPLQ